MNTNVLNVFINSLKHISHDCFSRKTLKMIYSLTYRSYQHMSHFLSSFFWPQNIRHFDVRERQVPNLCSWWNVLDKITASFKRQNNRYFHIQKTIFHQKVTTFPPWQLYQHSKPFLICSEHQHAEPFLAAKNLFFSRPRYNPRISVKTASTTTTAEIQDTFFGFRQRNYYYRDACVLTCQSGGARPVTRRQHTPSLPHLPHPGLSPGDAASPHTCRNIWLRCVLWGAGEEGRRGKGVGEERERGGGEACVPTYECLRRFYQEAGLGPSVCRRDRK